MEEDSVERVHLILYSMHAILFTLCGDKLTPTDSLWSAELSQMEITAFYFRLQLKGNCLLSILTELSFVRQHYRSIPSSWISLVNVITKLHEVGHFERIHEN